MLVVSRTHQKSPPNAQEWGPFFAKLYLLSTDKVLAGSPIRRLVNLIAYVQFPLVKSVDVGIATLFRTRVQQKWRGDGQQLG